MTPSPDNSSARAEAFIARWQGQEGGQERANYALFLTELCDVLGLPHPDVAKATHAHNDYVFERAVQRHLADGDSAGRIDLYKRNSFVLEAKQSRWKGAYKEIAGQNDLFSAEDDPADRGRRGANRAWDVLMLNAKRQAEEYARALPTSHGWPRQAALSRSAISPLDSASRNIWKRISAKCSLRWPGWATSRPRTARLSKYGAWPEGCQPGIHFHGPGLWIPGSQPIGRAPE